MSQRGPYAKGIAKRQEIIDLTLDLVAQQGWRHTSNAEIASRVGLSQAGLVHYYASREELAVAVLLSRDEHDRARFFDPNPTFEGFIEIVVHNTTVPGLVQLYVECASEATMEGHPGYEFFQERIARIRGHFVRVIESERAAGEFGPGVDAEATADLLIAASDGLQLQWLLDPSVDMAAQLRRMWDGIRAHSWAETAPGPRSA